MAFTGKNLNTAAGKATIDDAKSFIEGLYNTSTKELLIERLLEDDFSSTNAIEKLKKGDIFKCYNIYWVALTDGSSDGVVAITKDAVCTDRFNSSNGNYSNSFSRSDLSVRMNEKKTVSDGVEVYTYFGLGGYFPSKYVVEASVSLDADNGQSGDETHYKTNSYGIRMITEDDYTNTNTYKDVLHAAKYNAPYFTVTPDAQGENYCGVMTIESDGTIGKKDSNKYAGIRILVTLKDKSETDKCVVQKVGSVGSFN